MEKKLLLFILPLLLFTANMQAQDIKYWDFGAKELGAGYSNMLPLQYLNAFANFNRNIDLDDGNGNVYTVPDGFENESGQSVQSIFGLTYNSNYASGNFEITSKGSSPTPPGGTLLSGESLYTHPPLPDLDGATDLVFAKDSNSDRLITTRTDITRYDDRLTMPDGMDKDLFPGCIQFTTPGDKRYNSTRYRGFSIYLEVGQWITVVGSGQYTDIEGDGSLGFKTGYFSFETLGGTGTVVEIADQGAGLGNFDGPIDGSDKGDEAVRVMQFQAVDAGYYRLANRGGKIRVYRLYLGQVDASLGAGLETKIYVNGVYSKTLGISKNIRVSTDVKAINNRIYVSNVKSSTEINIYSITGALVKSLKTNKDTNFEFKSGLWIATVKTEEGQKSVKLLTR
ncbi:T9SS type A sorting domain-containing protein [Thalassobellus suaedae]|uniref:T9SS type A sorting domain-containing protein n=1 Tax=Thalassobellus suaedae TaxID=3074124 RepID=A0ABY9XWT4_9FLAO|nr:T9SS type A sorting domain-containing protein [Flavobacteriaceae bacterium HL-DH14]